MVAALRGDLYAHLHRLSLDLLFHPSVRGPPAQPVDYSLVPTLLYSIQQPLHLPYAQVQLLSSLALGDQVLLRLFQGYQPVSIGLGH